MTSMSSISSSIPGYVWLELCLLSLVSQDKANHMEHKVSQVEPLISSASKQHQTALVNKSLVIKTTSCTRADTLVTKKPDIPGQGETMKHTRGALL